MDENKTYEIAGYKFVDDGRFDSHAADVELWGQSVPVVLETDGDVSDADLETRVAQKLEWVEENQADIEAEFLKEQGHHIDIVNELILNGKFSAPKPITEDDFLKALLLEDVRIIIFADGPNPAIPAIEINFAMEPDYIFGHMATIEVKGD